MSTVSSSSKPSSGWQPPTLEEMQAMLPQYQFEYLLGRGGMGAVYKALQITLDRPVAIKVLPGDLIEDSDSQFAERFKNEARTMGKMNHPAIVNVYDFGETNTGLLYIVMEFIDGTDVSKMIAVQGKLPEDYALSITAHVCDALAYAHSHGVIHRDIKPANILINMDGAVKVADFGLAKANDPSQSGITKTNMAMGTPDFVAPEAFVPGVPLDGRADLYAIGVMLYQMLTGEIPRGIWTLPGKKLGTDPRFDSIITKAMQTDREERYQSAADLRRDLDTILTLPRAALIEHQQAAAEAAAQATRAQKQVASGPQRRPAGPPAHAHPPPSVKKKSAMGPVLGVLSSVVLVAGLTYVLKEPAADETIPDTAPDVTEATPKPVPATNVTSAPSPSREPITKPQPPVANSPSPPPPVPSAPLQPGWTDLLADVDVRRDAVNGRWEMTPEGLTLKKEHAVRALEFNQHAPEEYDFEIEFTVTDGWSDVSQLLSVAGRTLRWKMAQGTGEFYSFGPMLDGKKPDDPARTEAVVQRQRLKVGQRHRSTVEVRKGSLRALLDGEEVLRWSGDLQRMSDENSSTVRDGRHVGLACYATAVTFHKAQMRPVTSGVPVAASRMTPAPVTPAMTAPAANPTLSPGWTDLLALVDVQRDAEKGDWKMTPEGLVTDGGGVERLLLFQQKVPEEYDYQIEFTCKSNDYRRCVMILPLPNGTIQWVMGGGVERDWFAFGPKLDGISPDKRTEAVASHPKLEAGHRYRCLIEVRKDSLRTMLDGEELLKWRGDLKRLSADQSSKGVVDPKRLGLGTYRSTLTVHKAEVRPVMDGVPVPTPTDPHLAKLEAGFNSRYESDVQKPYLTAVAALNKSYLANGVAKARAVAQSRGSLKEVIAFDEVKARIERGEGVPEEDEPGTPESLKSLRAIYRDALAKITAERDSRASPLYDIYVRALDAYVVELTKANKLNEVRQVKALRADIAAKKPAMEVVAEVPTPPSAPPTGSPPPPSSTSSTTATPLSSGSSWRTAADFLVANGGSFVAAKNGGTANVSTPEEIPSGRFDILELSVNRDRSVLPPLKDADFAAFAGLRDLRRVHIRPSKPGLTDAAFAFLSSNSDLTSVNLDGVPDVTDAVLVHLSGARKLDNLSIQNASQFTGRGLDKLACTSSLTTLELMGSGLTDDGIRALAAFKKLQTLHLNSKSVTDVGFAALGDVSSLNALNLTGTAFGDESAASLARLTKLTSLDLSNTKITDLGLKKLLSLKKLTSLNLSGTAVTLEAAAEFQKVMPQCRVSR